MTGFDRGDLLGEYAWTEYGAEDPRVSGELDDTHFNANEGHEVLYLINALSREWDLRNIKSGHKMERMLRDLPSEIRSQAQAKAWIKEKWTSYKFKVAKGSARVARSHESAEGASGGEDHHYCANCGGYTQCETIRVAVSVPSAAFSDAGAHYLKRHRKCAACNLEFETVEVNARLLHELHRLRGLVANIRNALDASVDPRERREP